MSDEGKAETERLGKIGRADFEWVADDYGIANAARLEHHRTSDA